MFRDVSHHDGLLAVPRRRPHCAPYLPRTFGLPQPSWTRSPCAPRWFPANRAWAIAIRDKRRVHEGNKHNHVEQEGHGSSSLRSINKLRRDRQRIRALIPLCSPWYRGGQSEHGARSEMTLPMLRLCCAASTRAYSWIPLAGAFNAPMESVAHTALLRFEH